MRPPYAREPLHEPAPVPASPLASLLSGVRAVVARLPQYPPAAAGAVMLNLALKEVLAGPALDTARGKLVRVEVTDLGLTLSYRVQACSVAASAAGVPDVTIAADSAALWSLVSGRADADTLFFSRKLVMTGDTELGLLIRNTLDAVDRRQLLQPRLPAPGQFLAAVRAALGGREPAAPRQR